MYPMVAIPSQSPLRRAAPSHMARGCIVHGLPTQAASAALTAKTDAGIGGIFQPSPWATASCRMLSPLSSIVEKRFAVLGNEGVEIDQRANPVRHPVGDVARDDTTVGSSDQ